jgi:peptidoglycan hydrolase-like protein with peptidoglycan-binding domain
MARLATDFIEKSVGAGGVNQRHDVVRIQALLNAMPTYVGGPEPRLKQDGFAGAKTIAAIQGFQRMNFGEADGRVDPGKRMEKTLIDFEMRDGTRPLNQIGPSLDLARAWMRLAYPIVVAHIDTSGKFTDRGAQSDTLKQLFTVGFGHPFVQRSGAKRPITARELERFRQTWDRAARIISAQPTVIAIRNQNTDDSLQEPTVHTRPPLLALRSNLLLTYRLTDWDDTSGYGTGPMTRAGLLLQAAFDGAIDTGVTDLTADKMWIESGFADATVTLIESSRYNWLAQALAQGKGFRFFHVPRQGIGWKDVPNLP